MHTILQWLGLQGQWTRSAFSDLPELEEDRSATVQRWRVIAGGLALILSRAGPQAARRFPAALELYRLLRRRLGQARRVDATAELLTEVLHEITDIADPMTKSCIHGCLQTSLREAKRRGASPATSSMPSSCALSGVSTRHSSRSAPQDDAVTEISTEVICERSIALRQAIATARTGFVDLDRAA